MLREADRVEVDADAPVYTPTVARAATPPAAEWTPARYGQSRRLNGPVAILVILLHVALAAILLTARQHFAHKQAERLTVLHFEAPPPPPPVSAPTPDKPVPLAVETPVVVPQPVVQTPAPPSPVQATPEPTPPTPPAPPVATPGPPAPVLLGPVRVTDLSDESNCTKSPRYSVDSRRAHEEGTVLVSLVIGADGSISRIGVGKSSGFRRLDDAAVEAVKSCHWKPQLRAGQPISVQGTFPVSFALGPKA